MAKPAISTKRDRGGLAAAIERIERPIAEAATKAMRAMSDDLKDAARRDIAGAGFASKWQKALRVDAYPRRGVSTGAAAMIYHRIKYADVFESGAVIRGRPLLWVPMTSIGVPPKLGREKLTPKLFNKKIGPLDVVRKGKRPILVAPIELTKTEAKAGQARKVTLAKLRRGAAQRGRASPAAVDKIRNTKNSTGVVRAVPIFVGVDSVDMPDRFRIREITRRQADRLPGLYARFLIASDD